MHPEESGLAVHEEPGLAGNRDRLKWNARYADRTPSFDPHPLALLVLSLPLPPGPVLELACGPSGSALLAAGTGRPVTAVDASDLALRLLAAEAARRGSSGHITPVHADLRDWRPQPDSFALVLCTGYWDPALFRAAAAAVTAGGLLAWEALTASARLGPDLRGAGAALRSAGPCPARRWPAQGRRGRAAD
jgi:SAM-dependent methyltransferase